MSTPYILLHSGHTMNLGRPLPSMVRIEDIAHALGLINRFTGHTRRPYSVAEHSLLVTEILERDGGVRDAMCLRAALLHDAHEAYTGDLATPIKHYCGPEWRGMEAGIEWAIAQHFGTAEAARAHRYTIKHADLVALATERRDLMPQHPEPWPVLQGVQPVDWIDLNDREGLDWDDWRLAFMEKHELLSIAIDAMHPQDPQP